MKKDELKMRIYSLLICGIKGKSLNDDERKIIKEGIGGIILFDRNCGEPEEVRALTDEIYLSSNLSPIIFVDQEGGRVRRLKQGYTRFPSQWTVGRFFELGGEVSKVYQLASAIARELRESGINANLSPVADVLENPENTVIGDRAFSNRVITVSELSLIYSAAFQDEGIISCAKHFPGHGNVKEDSHKELPVDNRSYEELMETSLRPFLHLIRNRVFSIMVGHILLKKIDPSFPASLSKKIIFKILRKEMKFDGLVLCDDLLMKAISSSFSLEESGLLAFEAGADMLLISGCVEEAQVLFRSLYDALKSGRISEERLKLSSDWILQIRKEFTKNRKYLPPLKREYVGSKEHKNIVKEIHEFIQRNDDKTKSKEKS